MIVCLPYFQTKLKFAFGWIVVVLTVAASGPSCAITNGNFERLPNLSWKTDGPNVQKTMQGDRPAIVARMNGSRYGHVGDVDGIGADGENPSRFFQWFSCADSVSIGQHCNVSFQYRTLLLPEERAWVRLWSPLRQSAVELPNANNLWAAGGGSILLHHGCGDGSLFLEFGILKPAGGQIGGRLSIDNVTHKCSYSEDEPPPPREGDWHFLPPIPEEEESESVIPDETSLIYGDNSLGLALLILAGIVIFVLKIRK